MFKREATSPGITILCRPNNFATSTWPMPSTNEIPRGSVTRETEITANVIALTRSIATQAIRLYTAVPSFGSRAHAVSSHLRLDYGTLR